MGSAMTTRVNEQHQGSRFFFLSENRELGHLTGKLNDKPQPSKMGNGRPNMIPNDMILERTSGKAIGGNVMHGGYLVGYFRLVE